MVDTDVARRDKLRTGRSMSPLDAEAMHERLHNLGYASIMQGSSMIQGGALAMAALTLVNLMSSLDWIRVLLWAASIAGINAIYVAYIRAAVMEPREGRFGQMSMMAVGVLEMAQFAILGVNWPEASVVSAWLLVSATGGCVLIWEGTNRTLALKPGAYASELAALIALARRTGWRRVIAMTVVVLIMAGSGLAIIFSHGGASLFVGLCAGILYGVLCLGVNIQVHFERLVMMRIVTQALQSQ